MVFLSSGVFAANVVVSGNITANTTWTSNNTYLLNGFVYVKSGATRPSNPARSFTAIKLPKARSSSNRARKSSRMARPPSLSFSPARCRQDSVLTAIGAA
jgi:hypothetical protein